MSKAWPRTNLGEVLRTVRRPVDINPDTMYREIGIRSHGKGVFHKEPVSGLELGNKRVFWVEPGCFVLNIVFAWEGAVAVLGNQEDGMIASHRFPMFRADDARINIHFLLYYFTTPEGLDLLSRVSPGGAGRNRTLSQAAFLQQSIPLPPLAEQRQVVARIEEIATQILKARTLREDATRETGALVRAALYRLLKSVDPAGKLGDILAAPPRNGWSARCDNADDGLPVLSLGAVTGFRYRSDHFKRTSLPVGKDAHYWLRPGDILITRSNTPELVGHVAIYDGTPSPCIYPDLIMRLQLRDCVDPRFIWYWLQSPVAREFITRNAKGTSSTMKKISQRIVMAIPFPSNLRLDEQRRIAAELDMLQAETDALKRLQAESASELNALLPAILSRAFTGRL